MKAILNKLYGNNKRSTSVKKTLTKVSLNIQSILKDELNKQNDGLVEMENAIEQISVLAQKLKDAQENQYNANNIFIEEFESVKSKLNELGIEMPTELNDLENEKSNYDQKYYQLVEKFENIDFSFNTFN